MNAIRTPWRLRWTLPPDALCATLFVLAHGSLLFAWPVVLAQDAPMWISEAGLVQAFFQGHLPGDCQFVAALPPNALSQGVIALLCAFLPAELAGRIYIVACVALFAAALVYLCRARGDAARPVALCCCLPLCVGYPLFHGFLNYMAAVPALCWGIGVLLRNPAGHGRRRTGVLLVMPLLTYLCHGTAVGMWAVLVFMHVIIKRDRAVALPALLGFVPVLWLIAAYVGQRHGEGAGVLWTSGSGLATIVYRLRSPLRFFSVFPGFEPTVDDPALGLLAPWLMVVNVVYAVGLSAYGLRWAWRARRDPDPGERWLSSSLLMLAGLFLVMPHDVAKMLNPAERLLIPAACLAAAGLPAGSRSKQSAERRAWVQYGLYALLAAQWAYLAVWGTRAATIADAFVQSRERYLVASTVQIVTADDVSLPSGNRAVTTLPPATELMTRHQVLRHQDMLADWTHGRTIVPADTGLFRCPGGSPRSTELAALRSAGSVLMLLGLPERAAAVAQALAPEFRVTRPGPGFWVLIRADRTVPGP